MKKCKEHFVDNQGLCHRCGIMMEPSLYDQYIGQPGASKEYKQVDIVRAIKKKIKPRSK